MTSNQPAVRRGSTPAARTPDAQQAEATVAEMIRGAWSAIAASLPDTLDSKRFARLVFNAVQRTPRLAQSTATSMIGSVLTASALGLEIGINNEAHLVPYKRRDNRSGREWIEAQLIIGYGGYAKLFQQHPMARTVTSGWVGEHDQFRVSYGSDAVLEHSPNLAGRGKPIAFWAMYELANGTRDFAVLSPEEVATLRKKAVDEPRDIDDPQHWMERKTVLKQVLKLAPKSTRMHWAMAVDEKPGGELNAERTHIAIAAGDVMPRQEQATPFAVEGDMIDPATGEIQEEPPADDTPPDQPAPANTGAKRPTVTAILRELERCGVDPRTADSYLPALGVPRDRITDLTQPEAVELLEAVRKLDRDTLARAAAEHAGRQL